MNRRRLLAGAGIALSTTLSGCLGNIPTGSSREQTYDECPRSIVGISWLPEPAKNEVTTALNDGVYESNDPLVLEDVMDTETAYLRYDGEYYKYYEPIIETEGKTRTLRLAEAHPETNEELTILNQADKQRTITLRLRLDDETVFTDEFELTPDEEITISGDVNWRLGLYRVEVETETLSAETDWEIDQSGTGYYLLVDDEDISIGGPEAMNDRMKCNWNATGGVNRE